MIVPKGTTVNVLVGAFVAVASLTAALEWCSGSVYFGWLLAHASASWM
jgi:hypothetical protein